MKQILLNSSGAVLAKVPRPPVKPKEVLVQVEYSMISVGTEVASLRPSSDVDIEVGALSRVRNKSVRVKDLAQKAANNPDIAKQRIKQLTLRKIRSFKRHLNIAQISVSSHKTQLPSDVVTIGNQGVDLLNSWVEVHASRLNTSMEYSSWSLNGKVGLYQLTSPPIEIPPGFSLLIELVGTFDGEGLVLGALEGDGTHWVSQTFLDDDFEESVRVKRTPQGYVTLVWSLSQESARSEMPSLDLNSCRLRLIPESEGEENANDLDDTGWGVGYSASGTVIAIGENVEGIRPGDRVACAGAGYANHAQVISVPRNLVAPVPEKCSMKAAATTTIGTIALQGIRRANPSVGETVCVVGLGIIGLITCQILNAAGCKVLGLDPQESRVARAVSVGIEGGAISAPEFLELVNRHTAGRGADATIITAASKSHSLINNAMKTTRRKGRVVIVGDIGLSMERPDLYKKEIDVLISSSYGPGRYDYEYEVNGIDYPYSYVRWTLNRNMEAYLDLAASGRIDVEELIDLVVPLSEAPDTYQLLAQGIEVEPVGVLIEYPVMGDDSNQGPNISGDAQKLIGGKQPKVDRRGYALVGAGAFGTSMLVPELSKYKKDIELRAVVSSDAVRGGNYARAMQIPTFASTVEAIASDESIDTIVIASRHNQHARQVVQGLLAGKNVFVEKPLALSWDELSDVNDALSTLAPGQIFTVGYNRRFSPSAKILKARTESRSQPLIINYRVNGGFIALDNWIQTAEGGGRNLGEACHMYDFFRYLIGYPVVSITAESITPVKGIMGATDNFTAILTYEDGSMATLIYTANGPKSGFSKERVEITCDGEGYLLNNFESLYEYPSDKLLWSSTHPDKGHTGEIDNFVQAIVDGGKQPIPIDEVLETSAVSLHIEDLLMKRI